LGSIGFKAQPSKEFKAPILNGPEVETSPCPLGQTKTTLLFQMVDWASPKHFFVRTDGITDII